MSSDRSDLTFEMPRPRRECARDTIGNVESSLNINVRIDEHSEAPLDHWQDQLKNRRKRPVPPKPPKPPEEPDKPDKPDDDNPPEGSIDVYASKIQQTRPNQAAKPPSTG